MALRDKLRVLVVDDMSTSRGLLTQALDEIGVRNYRTEADGEVAWKSLPSNPVHLVISDYNMPKMDGLQLLRAIRSHRQISRTGFILVTGRASPDLIETAAKLGMNNYLKKPFHAVQLKKCIESIVGAL